MPPLSIAEMKRRRLKRDKEQHLVRQEEVVQNQEIAVAAQEERTEHAIAVGAKQDKLRRKFLEEGGVKVEGWRLNALVHRQAADEEAEEDGPDGPEPGRRRVDVPEPTDPALAVANVEAFVRQMEQEAANAEVGFEVADVLAVTGSAQEALTRRISSTGGSLEGVLTLTGELSTSLEVVTGGSLLLQGGRLGDTGRTVNFSELSRESSPERKRESDELALELEQLTRSEIEELQRAEMTFRLKAETLSRTQGGESDSVAESDGGRHMASTAVEELDGRQREEKERQMERTRRRRCELREEWTKRGMIHDSRVQERWKAVEEAQEQRRQLLKAEARRKAILRMAWMRMSRLFVSRREQAAALLSDAVNSVMGHVLGVLWSHIDRRVKEERDKLRGQRDMVRMQVKLRQESYEQQSSTGAVTRIARAYKCHQARTRVFELREIKYFAPK